MGYLDQALGPASGGQPHLFDSQTRLLQAALSLLANNGQTGGLAGLMERFQQAGLGQVFQSWIADGENQPVSAQEIEGVLGDGHLQQISEESGLPDDETAQRLSEMLPGLIDKATPNGKMPPGGLGDLGVLLGQFMGGQSA